MFPVHSHLNLVLQTCYNTHFDGLMASNSLADNLCNPLYTHSSSCYWQSVNTALVQDRVSTKQEKKVRWVFQSHMLTFHRWSQQKSKCNNVFICRVWLVTKVTFIGQGRYSEMLMTLFTQPIAVLHKYLNDKLKILCLLQFSLRLHRIPWEFPEFSMFREIPEYSSFPGLWPPCSKLSTVYILHETVLHEFITDTDK